MQRLCLGWGDSPNFPNVPMTTTTQKLSFSKDVVGDHFYDTKKAQAIGTAHSLKQRHPGG